MDLCEWVQYLAKRIFPAIISLHQTLLASPHSERSGQHQVLKYLEQLECSRVIWYVQCFTLFQFGL